MLAIIPARGGSKAILKKNIKPLCGKPLIAYTIEAAKAAKTIDRIIVSTDDPEIAGVTREYNVDIPFMRPEELARDNSLAIDNYIYTINRLNTEFSSHYEEFAVLLPTAPMRIPEDIDNAVELFFGKKADSVISCAVSHHPLEWIFCINDKGIIQKNKEFFVETMKNRQETKPVYVPNGAVNILTYSLLKRKRSYYSDKTYAYVMPEERSIDIDSMVDFDYVEYLMSRK